MKLIPDVGADGEVGCVEEAEVNDSSSPNSSSYVEDGGGGLVGSNAGAPVGGAIGGISEIQF